MGWISVDDDLPEAGQLVEARYKGALTIIWPECVAMVDEDSRTCFRTADGITILAVDRVTHWRPMPPMPTGARTT